MKRIQTQTLVIRRHILDEIIHGTRSTDIVESCAKQWGTSTRTVERHLAAVRKELALTVGSSLEEIQAILHQRYEQAYKDVLSIEAGKPTLNTVDERRKIIASHADLYGCGRAKEAPTININYLGLLPDSIREALHPVVYDENGVAHPVDKSTPEGPRINGERS